MQRALILGILSFMLAALMMCGLAISDSVYAESNPAETAVTFEIPPVGKLDALPFATIEKAQVGTWFHRLHDESKFIPENGYGGVDSFAITLLKGPSNGTFSGTEPARSTFTGTNWCLGVLTNSSFKSQLLGSAEATFAMHIAVPQGTFIAVSGSGGVTKSVVSNGLNSVLLPDDGITKVCVHLTESGDSQIVWSAHEPSNVGVIDITTTPPPTNGSAVDMVNAFDLPPVGNIEALPSLTIEDAVASQWFHRVYKPEEFGPPTWGGADAWTVILAVSNPSGWWSGTGQSDEVVFNGSNWCIAFGTSSLYPASGGTSGKVAVKLSMQSGSTIAVKNPFGVIQTAVSNDGGVTIVLPKNGITKVCVSGEAPGAYVLWEGFDPAVAFNVIDASQRPNFPYRVFLGAVAR